MVKNLRKGSKVFFLNKGKKIKGVVIRKFPSAIDPKSSKKSTVHIRVGKKKFVGLSTDVKRRKK